MSSETVIKELFEAIQEEALPAVWSRGVSHARRNALLLDSAAPGAGEIILRVTIENRAVSPKITLWTEEGDWYCDCGDRNDPCEHVAAGIIWVKRLVDAGEWENARSPGGSEGSGAPAANSATLRYEFKSREGSLLLERWITLPGGGSAREEPLTESLVAVTGGIRSGRLKGPDVSATKQDFAVDSLLFPSGGARQRTIMLGVGGATQGYSPAKPLDRTLLADLIRALEDHGQVHLDGKPVSLSRQGLKIRARVRDDGHGFRLERAKDSSILEVFRNGAVLTKPARADDSVTLRPVLDPNLTPREREWLPPDGLYIPPERAGRLVTEILPALRDKIEVDIETRRLPDVTSAPPRVEIRLTRLSPRELTVTPVIVYGAKGEPPIAEVRDGRIEWTGASRETVPVRDPVAERKLALRIQDELHLRPGVPTRFADEDAVRFTRSLLERVSEHAFTIAGDEADAFLPAGVLAPAPRYENGRLEIEFLLPGSPGNGNARAGGAEVFQAWRENANIIALAGGAWAELPHDWLNRYGERALELLQARDVDGRIPKHFACEVRRLFDETETPAPPPLASLADALSGTDRVPEADLPKDLRADLRSYQREGANWLCFLRDQEMGALLADDMGLGKTLQALCAIRGRTLIAAPTSVLYSWSEQIRRFRPETSFTIYHGPQRKLDPDARIVITSHAILRIDTEELTSQEWDALILDEAHAIKNPESQLARAAHSFKAGFRLALTGTPVENRITDIWSLFRFINPGLLGTREEFQERFGSGASAPGDELARRIRPFLLRRMKKDVAKELPPRTESVLECELSQNEREVYETVLSATKKEVAEKLNENGNVLAALEALLRLRQACCHPALLPGHASNPSSAKVELLLDSLAESIEAGHRALVFSQWTSFLDLIEPHLRRRGLRFDRLDGTTRDREGVVARFQSPAGADVLLMSLKAGGVGLTLTAADHVYITDPWWNPFAEDQAADRAHRIGQKNPVFIYRLVASKTIEERVLELQTAKRSLAGSVLEGGDAAATLTRNDILSLLS